MGQNTTKTGPFVSKRDEIASFESVYEIAQLCAKVAIVVCGFQLNKMLEEKLQPYIQNIENGVLPQPILAAPQNNDQKVHPFSATSFLISKVYNSVD